MELFKLLGTIAINANGAVETIDGVQGKAEKLASKLQAVGKKTTDFGNKINDAGKKLTKSISVPAVAAGGAVVAFANKSASTADNIDKMSQKIGVSRKAYQELDFICSQSGTSVDTLQAGMKSLTTAMDGAANGTKSNMEQFKKLGVSVTDANGNLRSQEDVMWETLSALQGMENQTEKARMATELFGRSGSELMPLLNGEAGSIEEMKEQAHELGIVMGDEAIDSGVEYTDKMDQLKRSFGTAATEIGSKLLPFMTNLGDFIIEKGIPAFKKLADKVEGVINWFTNLDEGTQKIIGVIGGVVIAIGPVLSVVGNLIKTVGNVISVGSKLLGFITGLNPVVLIVIGVITALIAVGVLLYKNWDKIKEKAIELKNKAVKTFNDMKDKVTTTFKNMKEKVTTTINNLKEKAVSVFNNIKDGISQKVEGVKNTVKTTFEKVKDCLVKPVETARDAIKKLIDKIKGFFNFEFKIPKIKLPHFSIKPSDWKIGDLLKGSIPSLGIDWYAKAMNNPMLLEKPTAFGVNSAGQIMAGGEAGSEVVSGTNKLMNMISNAVYSQNEGIVYAINSGFSTLMEFLSEYIPELSNMEVVMDSGALVGTLTPAIDKQLGKTMKLKERGI